MLEIDLDSSFDPTQVSCLEEMYQLDCQSFAITPHLFHPETRRDFLNQRGEQG